MENDLDEIELMCEMGHKFKRLYKNLTVLQLEDK
jgi:hypothetical protein